jgi:hypothetical protein
MVRSALARPNTVLTLALVGLAVVLLVGCRNLFQVCGPGLVITPTFDSTSVGGIVTFQAWAEGGGCGPAKSETRPVLAVWRVKDTTIARFGAITSDDLVSVTGMRTGETPIVAFRHGLTAVAYFQVNSAPAADPSVVSSAYHRRADRPRVGAFA